MAPMATFLVDAGAAVLGKETYGLKAGNDASFVIVNAPNAAAAVAAVPADRTIVRHGQFRDDSSRLRFESGHAGHPHSVAISATK